MVLNGWYGFLSHFFVLLLVFFYRTEKRRRGGHDRNLCHVIQTFVFDWVNLKGLEANVFASGNFKLLICRSRLESESEGFWWHNGVK